MRSERDWKTQETGCGAVHICLCVCVMCVVYLRSMSTPPHSSCSTLFLQRRKWHECSATRPQTKHFRGQRTLTCQMIDDLFEVQAEVDTQLWCQRKRNILINEWAGVLRVQFRLDTQLYSNFTLAAFWSSELEGDHRSKSLLLLDWLRLPASGSQLQHWSAMVYFSWTFCVLSLIESLNRIDFF